MIEEEGITSAQLGRLELILTERINEKLASEIATAPEVDISAHFDFMTDDIAVRIKQAVYGRKMEKEEARYPSDWWEAFKERWLPEWAKERWPIKWTVVTLTAREFYPLVEMPHKTHSVVIDKLSHQTRAND